MTGSEKYLAAFQKIAKQLDGSLLNEMQIEVAVVEVLNCVCLKLYKKAWANPYENPLTAKTRIFFSIWLSDQSIGEQKVLYNIHAFKLRHLDGYSIESRKFAALFRTHFESFEEQWPNVSVKFGPLRLMEGWSAINADTFEPVILGLAHQFLRIAHLVDLTLAKFKR